MSDDRPLDDPAAAIAGIRSDLDDRFSTLLARIHERPTGTVEMTLRSTAAPGTLLLQGQTVSRTTYAALWTWAQEQGRVAAGLFTVGDGSTTFGVPDFRGRVPVGASTGDIAAVGAEVGAATRTLTTANLPLHSHNVGVGVTLSQHEGHAHAINGGGFHGGHNSGSFGVAAGSAGAVASNGNTGGGDHNHNESVEGQGKPHSVDVNVTQSNAGSGTAFDNRPPMKALNYAIWV